MFQRTLVLVLGLAFASVAGLCAGIGFRPCVWFGLGGGLHGSSVEGLPLIQQSSDHPFHEADEQQNDVAELPTFVTQAGGCIPLAVAFALGGAGRVKDYLNTSKKKTGFMYCDFAKISVASEESDEDPQDLMSLVPSFGLNISEPGTYIIHAENNGSPHAICVIVSPSK